MRPTQTLLAVFLFLPALALGQSDPAEWSAPPLVNAQPEAAPPPPQAQPTPPPPGATPPPGYVPAQPPPYSPYGTVPQHQQLEPPMEIGLMITESAFGALTAAGTALIPYFLLLKPLGAAGGGGLDPGVTNLIFILVFSAVPLAVSQTELSLANGSRYYTSESWPASLSGLAAQASVIGLYHLLGGPGGGGTAETVLLVGTVAFVPLAEMIVINLTKQPKGRPMGPLGSLFGYTEENGLLAGVPMPAPLLRETRLGLSWGVQLPLLRGTF
ncbi:MAG: hypothetical protein ACOZIN_07180 [Myxococcota bacterium]